MTLNSAGILFSDGQFNLIGIKTGKYIRTGINKFELRGEI